MGVDTNLHIGPYLIVKGEKSEMKKREVWTCTNTDCETHKANKVYVVSQNFCAECGREIGVKQYEEEFKTDAHSLILNKYYELCDELSWTDPMGCGGGVFISNHYSPFDKERSSGDDDNEEITDLTNVNIKAEIDWFNTKYKTILDIFRKEFGEDSVEVRWGIIEWYS